MNIVAMTGRLTCDPEMKYTSTGTPYAEFGLAVRKRYPKEGDDTDFFNCTSWGKTAEYMSQYVHKGDMVEISGSINVRKWTANDNTKRTAYNIDVSECRCLKRSEKNESGVEGKASPSSGNEEDYDPFAEE